MTANDEKNMVKQEHALKSDDTTYTKTQILKSKRFSNYHDVLNVVLEDYSFKKYCRW